MILGEIDREQRRRRNIFVMLIVAVIIIGFVYVIGNAEEKHVIMYSSILGIE